MTDQYTPTTEEVRRGYSKLIARQRGSYSSICDEFDRWLAERDARIESAAEQRGAEHHLRLAASELNMHHLTEDLSDDALELGVRFINLIQDRADRIANKENE